MLLEHIKSGVFPKALLCYPDCMNLNSLFTSLPHSFNLVSVTLSLSILGCSVASAPTPVAPLHQVNSIELYMARGDLLAAPQFEQYKLSNNKLFGECGKVLKAGPVAAAQDLETVKPEQLELIKAKASEIVEMMQSEKPRLSESGNLAGFMASGKFELHINSGESVTQLETSLNSVAEPSSLAERRIHELTELLRSSAPNQCGNQSFFGIGASKRS